MKVGLAPYRFENNDIVFNLSQMEKAMKESQGRVDLLCFGETFLQGFDSLTWNYDKDKDIAITQQSPVMQQLCGLTVRYGTDLLFGYIERDGEFLYSSCAVIEKGTLIHNYRRISKNWKEYTITDFHYQEGTAAEEFRYHGKSIQIALCGDLWLYPERFRTKELLIWPVYVNFAMEEWPQCELEYAQQALLAAPKTVMINSITTDPTSHGNAFYFHNGKVERKLGYDTEDVLVIEL